MAESKSDEKILKKDKIRLWWVIGFIFFCFMVVLAAVFFYGKNYYNTQKNERSLNKEENKKKTCLDCVERYLDGLLVERGKENLRPIAIMIENHIDARPPAGLAKASLVYEAEAEGGITRFLAIFDREAEVKKIGPIRSARSYYLDWAQEVEALYVHCGGSPQALARILKEDINDLNEFYQGKFFWRDSLRPAPHNVFTSSESIKEYIALRNFADQKEFTPWQFKDELLRNNSLATSSVVAINYLSFPFFVEWRYNNSSNDYTRYQGGSLFRDEEGQEIKAKNIIIQFVKEKVVDELKRLEIATEGEGKAIICLDGQCQKAAWQKRSGERTRYYYSDSSEVKFNRGASWVEVVGEGYEVNF